MLIEDTFFRINRNYQLHMNQSNMIRLNQSCQFRTNQNSVNNNFSMCDNFCLFCLVFFGKDFKVITKYYVITFKIE